MAAPAEKKRRLPCVPRHPFNALVSRRKPEESKDPLPYHCYPATPLQRDCYTEEFQSLGASTEVLSVYQIFNPPMFARYQVECSITQSLRGNANEQVLLHGTTINCVAGICSQGVDPAFGGQRHGKLYGRAAYFTNSVGLLKQYSTHDGVKGRWAVMFLVTLGRPQKGRKDMPRPDYDPDPPILGGLFDSVVDQEPHSRNPSRIFGVFTTNKQLPLAVIHFRYDNDP